MQNVSFLSFIALRSYIETCAILSRTFKLSDYDPIVIVRLLFVKQYYRNINSFQCIHKYLYDSHYIRNHTINTHFYYYLLIKIDCLFNSNVCFIIYNAQYRVEFKTVNIYYLRTEM